MSGGKGVLAGGGEMVWAAVLSWNHCDGIVRIRNNRNQPPINFIRWNPNEQVKTLALHRRCFSTMMYVLAMRVYRLSFLMIGKLAEMCLKSFESLFF